MVANIMKLHTYIIGHHDRKQWFIVGVEGHIKGCCLNHYKNSMQD